MFNLSRHSQLQNTPSEFTDNIKEYGDQVRDDLNNQDQPTNSPIDEDALTKNLTPEQENAIRDSAAVSIYNEIDAAIRNMEGGEELLASIMGMPGMKVLSAVVQNQGNSDVLNKELERLRLTGVDITLSNSENYNNIKQDALRQAKKTIELRRIQQEQQSQQQVATFNLKGYKTAQITSEEMTPPIQAPMQSMPVEPDTEQYGSFPVEDASDLAEKFLSRILSADPNERREAIEEILTEVRGEIQEEEINSIIEFLSHLQYSNDEDQSKAMGIFGKLYAILPAHLKSTEPTGSEMETPVMSEEKPKGIIKHNLTNHIINNDGPVTKTAADQFGQSYVVYGPTEKRICPKLRGKNMGDFVSEYICRHHCLDGLAIDDNKTICGEALWRANAMDKYSREYVNEDGDIEGGYLNKRFEINRNVPEETKMRLKPGETRKSRPASIYGNYEARMQEMRNKEGEKRGYRPDTDTSEPFNWTKDVDQNNVETSQEERDRREKDSRHQTVQYSKKPPTDNNPKKAFNLKQYKTAQGANMPYSNDGKSAQPDGPAVEDSDGTKYWYQNGKRHRTDGPAIEWADGTKIWYQNGKLHRTDGPAIEYADGDKEWYHGKLHRTVDQKIRDPKELKKKDTKKTVAKVENDNEFKIENKTFPKDTGCTTCTESGEMPEKSGFNLKVHKISKKKILRTKA